MNPAPFHWSDQQPDNPAHEMLVAFLTMDIQQSQEWATELLNQIEAVKSGQLPQWERLGNAFHLEISNQGVLIRDCVDETSQEQQVSLEELHAATLAWLNSLS